MRQGRGWGHRYPQASSRLATPSSHKAEPATKGQGSWRLHPDPAVVGSGLPEGLLILSPALGKERQRPAEAKLAASLDGQSGQGP